ncbi:MAG TPA: vWA domain-containing protein [Candidatus Dormibacteraeota bacterium]|nr:vWA domain-containing protein [Candidatus Dormibacteraeota bacterium]
MSSPIKSRSDSSHSSPEQTFLLVFVLDRTGSMQSCYDATISGFNEFLHAQQKEKAGEASMTLVQFDRHADEPTCQTRYQATKLSRIADLGSRQNRYQPRGTTPLFDAVGETIAATDQVSDRYDHVLFIIQTDGMENASREYTQQQVFQMVGARRERGWDFIFLGADVDAYQLGGALNVPVGNTMSYFSASQAKPAFAALAGTATRYRRSGGATGGATEALANAPVARPGDAEAPGKGKPNASYPN